MMSNETDIGLGGFWTPSSIDLRILRPPFLIFVTNKFLLNFLPNYAFKRKFTRYKKGYGRGRAIIFKKTQFIFFCTEKIIHFLSKMGLWLHITPWTTSPVVNQAWTFLLFVLATVLCDHNTGHLCQQIRHLVA